MMTSQTTAAAAGSRQYWAFISYSHADEAWAKWLHRSLEKYRVPRRLVGRAHTFGKTPKYVRPVFRDRDELVSSPELSGAILEALAGSRELIVVCSPRAASSPYVNEEITQFKSLGRPERIRCLIVDGQPSAGASDCFPPALRSGAAGSSEPVAEPIEPLAADVRRGKDGKRQALLKILAGILDVPYDELRRREQRRRRQRLATAALCIALLSAVTFVGLSDAGMNLPYSEPVRARLDRTGVTLFRPVHEPEQMVVSADQMRARLVPILHDRRDASGLYAWDATKEGVETWASAQTLGALVSVPETTRASWPQIRGTIDRLFTGQYFADADDPSGGGWLYRTGRPSNGNITLWMVAALAEALSRRDLIPDSERPDILAYYHRAVRAAARLSPLGDGGWNMFALQEDPRDHNHYTGALALHALLVAHAAGLPWAGGEAPLPSLSLTAKRLVEDFAASAEDPGWRRSRRDGDVTHDGLTLQIYGLLLRAEAANALTLPDPLVAQMTRHLVSLADRDLKYPTSSADFYAIVAGKEESEGIGFLWFPWAISAADLWLQRNHGAGAAPENARRVQRSLGHLVVDLGDDFVAAHSKEHTFRAAELLWNLSGRLWTVQPKRVAGAAESARRILHTVS
jgi:hypothetical protein